MTETTNLYGTFYRTGQPMWLPRESVGSPGQPACPLFSGSIKTTRQAETVPWKALAASCLFLCGDLIPSLTCSTAMRLTYSWKEVQTQPSNQQTGWKAARWSAARCLCSEGITAAFCRILLWLQTSIPGEPGPSFQGGLTAGLELITVSVC